MLPVLVLLSLLPSAQKAEPRAVVARQFSAVGTLLAREAPGKPWTLPALYDSVHSGDQLVALPGARAMLDLKEGDVRLSLVGNLPELSQAPVLESVVTLHASKEVDVNLTLDRGRVLVESRAEKGVVNVRVRFRGNMVEVALAPKAMVALERFGFWPRGTPFLKKPPKDHEPESEVVFMTLKGSPTVTFEGESHVLKAPLIYQWNIRSGVSGPFPLKKMPAWLTSSDTAPRTLALHAAVEKLRRRLAEAKEVRTLKNVLDDKDELVRAVAVHSAVAVDEIGPALDALGAGKHAEARRAAAAALRHWIAREAAHDQRFYELVLQKNCSPGEAELVLQLLHTFGDRDLARPETYEALINHLASPKIAIRELGHGQLVRLVPAGRAIPFDAGAASDRLEPAQAAWRKLIPPGQLPKRN